MNASLIQAVRDKRAILFVGAGVSRACGLPSWNELIRLLALELGYDPDVFSTLGTSEQLGEYYRLKVRKIGALRSKLDRSWHASVDVSKSRIHQMIVQLGFPIIYTTNYDRLIETAFEHYGVAHKKIVGASDLINTEGTQIVKFHGDFDDDLSIVISESDFFERMDFESPLDIKLRSDMLGRSVLFIGYSLSDMNLRYMIFRLKKIWEKAAVVPPPESYIFMMQPNAVHEAILDARHVKPIIAEKGGLEEFLEELLRETGAPTSGP